MTGILFTARLGSQRLPKKHLIEVGGRTFIEWLVLRYAHAFKEEISNGHVKLIVTTSVEKENYLFEAALKSTNAQVFYGSPENIPLRHLQCAEEHGLTHIISVDGDDILCSAEASLKIYSAYQQYPDKDMISSTGLPLGMNSSAYLVSYLAKCLKKAEKKKLETGWGRIFTEADKSEIICGNYSIYDKLRFTLDYKEDADFFIEVIRFFGNDIVTVSDPELISAVLHNKFDSINSHLYDIYWNNYKQLRDAEQNEETAS